MLAAQGSSCHQHANSGWGTFDDDNMVGATAFMETLELALELSRAGYGGRRTARVRSLSVHGGRRGAVQRILLQWRFIDAVAARIDDTALREAQQRKDAVAPTRSSTPLSARRHA